MTHGDGPGVFCLMLALDVRADSTPHAAMIAKHAASLLASLCDEAEGPVPCCVAGIERLSDLDPWKIAP